MKKQKKFLAVLSAAAVSTMIAAAVSTTAFAKTTDVIAKIDGQEVKINFEELTTAYENKAAGLDSELFDKYNEREGLTALLDDKNGFVDYKAVQEAAEDAVALGEKFVLNDFTETTEKTLADFKPEAEWKDDKVVPVTPVEEDLKVESVSAITATGVTVEIAELAKDLVDANVVVKNVGGQVYATKAMSIPAGTTTVTFAFETPLTVTPSEGWTVDGVKYEVEELEIVNVERLIDSGKFLEVQFNKALSSLDASELNVRQTSTSARVGVEKVALASDGLSATITLLGEEGVATFVRPHIDYTLSITQNGKVTSTVFNLDHVRANVAVTEFDKKENRVTIGGVEYKLADNVKVDFEEILGRDTTIWIDKDGFIVRLDVQDQTVKYEAVKVDLKANGTRYFVAPDKTEYRIVDSEVVAGSPSPTTVHTGNLIEKGQTTATLSNIADKREFEYAKLVFNNLGQVKSVVALEKFSGSILAEKTQDTTVTGYKQELNLKDYSIVKNGKTINVSDIKAGDVVYYNNSLKFADVYNATKSGKIEAVYKNEFKFDGKIYEITGAKYIANGKVAELNQSGLEALYASDKEVTINFNRKGEIEIISGELGEVVSNTSVSYLTKDGNAYTLKNKGYLELVTLTSAGKEVTEDFSVEDLEFIQVGKTKYEVGKSVAGQKVTKIKYTTGGLLSIEARDAFDEPITASKITVKTDLAKGDVVEVVKNSDGDVVGLVAKPAVTTNAPFKLDAKSITVGGSINLQLAKSTPVFWIDSNTKKVSVKTFGELSNIEKIAVATVYHDGKDVEYLVINSGDTNAPSTLEDSHLVIADIRLDTKDNVAYIKFAGKATDTAIGKDISGSAYKVGDVVQATINTEDGKLNSLAKISARTKTGKIVSDSVSTVRGTFDAIVSGTTVKYTKSEKGITVYELEGEGVNQTVKEVDFNKLSSLNNDNVATIYLTTAGQEYVDYVVITKDKEVANVLGNGKITNVVTTQPNTGDDIDVTFTASAGEEIEKDTARLQNSVVLKAVKDANVSSTATVGAPETPVFTFNGTSKFIDLLKLTVDGQTTPSSGYTYAGTYKVEGTVDDGAALTIKNLATFTVAEKFEVDKTTPLELILKNNFGAAVDTNTAQNLLDASGNINSTVFYQAGDYKVEVIEVKGTTTAASDVTVATTAATGNLTFAKGAGVTEFTVKITAKNGDVKTFTYDGSDWK